MSPSQGNRRLIYAATLMLVIVGSLLVYKGTAALAAIVKVQYTGALQSRVDVVPTPGNAAAQVNVVARSINYFLVIWPALLFGILISGAVSVLVPPRWLGHALGSGRVRPQLVAGLAGAPLMLCSCCAAPVFSGLYERSSRLGPSLAVMLAAPSLNPAALILTFMLFDHRIALTRLAGAGAAVFLTGIFVDKLFPLKPINCSISDQESNGPLLTTFLRSCMQVAVRTVPLIAVGVLISMAIALWLPVGALASTGGQTVAIVVVALIAVPLALPTFFEIPLALILLLADAPAGAAVAMMIAGPAVNLPSLFTISRSTNWKVAGSVALMIFVLSVAAGLLVSLF
ncbi:MAG TPA: permease [Pyrinomonadaceae bacterium]|nr:permease [Pyrinomonadaceae bacterium]